MALTTSQGQKPHVTPWAGNHQSQGVYAELWRQMEQVGFAKEASGGVCIFGCPPSFIHFITLGVQELDDIERLLALVLLLGNLDFSDETESTLGMHQGCGIYALRPTGQLIPPPPYPMPALLRVQRALL